MEPITKYLVSGELPQDKKMAQKLLYQALQHKAIKSFSSISHPQENRQVEAVNNMHKDTLKKRLEQEKDAWPKELPRVRWIYRTTARMSTEHSPFSMAYGYEAMLLVEAAISMQRRTTYDPTTNHALLQELLDLVEELCEDAQLRVTSYQQMVSKYFNSKVKDRKFEVGDLVLRRVFLWMYLLADLDK
ncbi:uncharacterized protein LOC133821772 [Humulus lupulus]|uniref:uncharacterized protein LOC133821772 n=1 Tax=Humulus lupulus TaxID=3486 RepID=UPI002B407932|nr:uncharacterized protein LOC133821772 [Humulus lupulus]